MYISPLIENTLKNKFNPLLSRIQDELNNFLKEKGYETIQLIDYRFEIYNSDVLGISKSLEINFCFILSEDINDLLRDRIYEIVWEYIDNNKIGDKIRGIAIRSSIMRLILKRTVINDILDSIKDIK